MPATKEKTYNESEIAERLKALPGWYYEDGWIRRVFKTDGWPTTLMLVNLSAIWRRPPTTTPTSPSPGGGSR